MSRHSLARRLHGLVLLVAISTGLACAWLGASGVLSRVEEQVHAELEVATAHLLSFAADVLAGSVEHPDERAAAMAAGDGERITVIARDGTVRAESEGASATMENHRGRPELTAALARGLGRSRRFSKTLGQEMVYVARRVDGEGSSPPAGCIRVSRSSRRLLADVSSQRARAWRHALLAAAGAAMLGSLFVRRITRPLESVAATADAMGAGDHDLRVREPSPDEVGRIGTALNALCEEVVTRRSTIAQEEDQLRTVLTGMVEGVIALDEGDRIVLCNRAARRLLHIDDEDPRGAFLWEVVRRPELQGLIERARVRERVARGDLDIPTEDGITLLEVHANAFGPENSRGVAVVLHDVTELRRLEGIRRDFVANVSHELKTPLTSIRGYVETLLDGAIDDEENNVRFLSKIDDSVRRLTHLVSDLLSLGRIEAQGASLETGPVDWRHVVQTVYGHHEAAARGRDIDCDLAEAEGSVVVLGDHESMVQIADNLLSNAVKYTAAGGRIRLRTSIEEGRGVLEVSDTGIGIPPRDIDRVFERFFRVDKARSRDLGGTGLGLAIVKHLTQAMGGEVRVESEVGVGSRFVVALPLAGA